MKSGEKRLLQRLSRFHPTILKYHDVHVEGGWRERETRETCGTCFPYSNNTRLSGRNSFDGLEQTCFSVYSRGTLKALKDQAHEGPGARLVALWTLRTLWTLPFPHLLTNSLTQPPCFEETKRKKKANCPDLWAARAKRGELSGWAEVCCKKLPRETRKMNKNGLGHIVNDARLSGFCSYSIGEKL